MSESEADLLRAQLEAVSVARHRLETDVAALRLERDEARKKCTAMREHLEQVPATLEVTQDRGSVTIPLDLPGRYVTVSVESTPWQADTPPAALVCHDPGAHH